MTNNASGRRQRPHVVILGGGFAGLAAAKGLRKEDVDITLIDRRNHFLFQPLLYQVATAGLAAPDISAPIRKLLWRQRNVTVWMAEVTDVDLERKQVLLDERHVSYDYLVVAVGMTHGYFGHGEWAKYAPGLKTVGEALDVRRRILHAFEAAELAEDEAERRALSTFVVIGGGPTGVELAGALAEIARHTLPRDFRRFDPSTTRVLLVEAGPRLLPGFHESLSETAARDLRQLGVEVQTDAEVRSIGEGFVEVAGERVVARTILWGAGVRAHPLTHKLGVPLDRSGRVRVNDTLNVDEHPEVFITGDLIAKEQDGKPLPGVAQLAMQSGAYAAKSIGRLVRGKALEPFEYVDKGSMATIGRNRAIVELGKVRLTGFLAWFVWLTVHIMALVEFRRRIVVLFQWAWAYFTWQRASRVIVEMPKESHSLSDLAEQERAESAALKHQRDDGSPKHEQRNEEPNRSGPTVSTAPPA